MTKSSFEKEKGEVGSQALAFDDPLRNRKLDVLTDQCLCGPTQQRFTFCCQAVEISHFNVRLLLLHNKLKKT